MAFDSVRKYDMIHDMAMKDIRQHIATVTAGEPFTSSSLLRFGSRASVDQALSRLSKAGTITRVTRGVFVRPKQNRYVGEVPPEPYKVAEAIAASRGELLQISGAEAARQLQLTTQVPVGAVYYTTGPTRTFSIGKLPVKMKHTSRHKLSSASGPAGVAIVALHYLGKEKVTPQVIETLRRRLSAAEFHQLMESRPSLPTWMANCIYRYQQEAKHKVG
jgi:hypothetical protein